MVSWDAMATAIRLIVLVCVSSILTIPIPVFAQTQTASEFWPTLNVKFRLHDNWRALAFAGLKKGEENEYQQLNAGLGFGRQLKLIRKPHPENADSDKEHTFVLAGGYERLQTFQSGTMSNENRMALQATAGFRPLSSLLLSDRSRVEFRWRDSGYSTRYRNNGQALYDITIREFHFCPYGGAEFFYDGAKGEWSREQYTGGIEWPLGHKMTLQTYYLRQNNSTEPDHLNVGGLTLNLNFK
jgi:Protein of unknown function (DUF2490)